MKNVVVVCLCLKSLPEAKVKSSGLITRGKEISEQPSGAVPCDYEGRATLRKGKYKMHGSRRKGHQEVHGAGFCVQGDRQIQGIKWNKEGGDLFTRSYPAR